MSQTDKCSLILRLWREDNSEVHNWRASVEIPQDGRRIGFSNLDQLFAFLIDLTETNCEIQLMNSEEMRIQNKKRKVVE